MAEQWTIWITLRLLLGAAWSAVMLLAGLTVLHQGASLLAGISHRTSTPTIQDIQRFVPVAGLLGVCLFVTGVFVFCSVVADRLFPRADHRITGWVQRLAAWVLMLSLLGGVGWWIVTGR
jgi:hypothetical protein